MGGKVMEGIERLLPSLIIDSNYRIVATNQTAKDMFGEITGKECYKVLYNLETPCYQHGIKCPVYGKENGFDIVNFEFESYLRGYGVIPWGGMFYESVVNITNINNIRSSFIDSLTQLHNRKFMLNFLEKTHNLWKRYKQTYTLLFMDLDNLKEINDNYGHAAGDEALIKLSLCIKAHTRSSDTAARWSGDEFLMVLPNTSIEYGEKVALRIIKCVSSIQFFTQLSVSIGASQPSDNDKSYSEVLARADKALYQAKQSGKSKVAVLKADGLYYLIDIKEESA
jgi:diguanylate cyclase (GGDEF)-like protein